MSALSANKQRPYRAPAGGLTTQLIRLAGYTNYGGGSTAFTVYKGALMMCDVSDTDGYFSPVHGTPASGDLFGGIAMERQDVTSSDTADGSVELTVATDGVWAFAKGSLAITDIGAVIYATTDNDIQTSSTNAQAIGVLVDVDGTYAWIDISSKFMVAI